METIYNDIKYAGRVIIHGIRMTPADGKIRINAFRNKEFLVFTVEDNGPGFQDLPPVKKDSIKSEGVGLKNVHERIGLYYGSGYGLHAENLPEGGARVTLRLGTDLKEKESNHSPV